MPHRARLLPQRRNESLSFRPAGFRPLSGPKLRAYLLVEHKSNEEKDTLAQLLELLTRVTLHLRAEGGREGFTPVLALVLHHGERPWQSSTSLFDHYLFPEGCGEAFRKFALGFEAILLDLRKIPMGEIHNAPPVEALLKALKAVKEGLEEPFLEELKVLARAGELKGYLATLLLYVLCAGRGVTKAQVLEVAKSAEDDKLTSDVMTGAEILKEEGKTEGKQEGKLEGLEQGRLIGQILFIQEMLGREPAKSSDLEQWTLERLRQELGQLRAEWLKQG